MLVPERRPTLQHRLEYMLLTVAGSGVRLLPAPAVPPLSRGLARLTFSLLRLRRRVTLENLLRAFPHESEPWRREVAFQAYVNLATVGVEMLRSPRLSPQALVEVVRLSREDEALYHLAMREGRGVVLVGGHYGNWELLAARIAGMGFPAVGIVKAQRNPLMDRALSRTRQHLGLGQAGLGAGIRTVLRTLRSGGAVMMLADQDAGLDDALFLPFFGIPAATYRGPAVLAVRSGAPLVAAWIRREGEGYQAGFQRLDHQALADLPPGAEEETRIVRLTEAYVAWLEQTIRVDPGQYLWLHRRWKSRPPGQPA